MGDSLLRKFLLPILFGAAVLILSATYITHSGLLPELRSQLHKRAELMLITIRAAAEINPGYQDLRLALEEITLQTSGVYGITLATLDPTIIWASSTHPDADLDKHTAEMLELLENSAKQHLFGDFIQKNGDVIVISPFKLLQGNTNRTEVDLNQVDLPKGVTFSEAYTLKKDSYEGILYLRFNWAEAEALANKDLVNHILALSAAILLMLFMAIFLLYRVILNPLHRIGHTIQSQQEGQSDARTNALTNDEIGLLGHSINEMLDDLNNRDQLLHSVVDHLPVGLSLKTVSGNVLLQNDVYRSSYMSSSLKEGVREKLLSERASLQDRVVTDSAPNSHEEMLRYKDHNRHFETTVFPIFNTHNQTEWIGTLCFEITEKKEREQQLTQLYKAVESVKSGIVICQYQAPDYPIIYINPAVTKITGYASADILGRAPSIFSKGTQAGPALETIRLAIANKEPCSVVLQNKRKDGTLFWNEFTLSVITDVNGEVTHLVGVQNDVSDRVEAANQIEHLAYFDSLTDIPNRTLFQDRLTQAISESYRTNKQTAVLYIDLDGFKSANDTFGHSTGDQLLKEACVRIKQCIRDQDSLARMGGDEFTILIPNLNASDIIADLPKVVNRINMQLSMPFEIFQNLVHISASIGISLYPRDGDSAEELIINADHAMYHAKESGKNTYRFFQHEMNHAIDKRQRIESSLREAVHNKEFSLHYQPQVDLQNNSLSVEALIRSQHPELKDLSPAIFIPIAEQSGLIDEIGIWVIQQACAEMSGFIKEGSQIEKVAINISPQQFKRQNLTGIIKRYLDHYDLPSKCLEVEITENIIIDDYELALSHLNELRELGVTIAIDDFGTGYSSLTYLKQLPIDTLKLDKQFIHGVPGNQDDEHIVRAIAGLAKGMGLTVLAEGVETDQQLTFIRQELNCHLIQGYHISKPLSLERLKESDFYK